MTDEATRREDPPATPSYLAGADGPRRAPLERGEVVGRYIVLDELGAGAMGAVYRAYDPELDRKVALKLILAEPGQLESTLAGRVRLQREAQAMARLSHPNVIAVHDVGTHGNEVFLAMELVGGISLAEWIQRHWESTIARTPRGWRKVRDVFLQAGHGLAAAHAAGLIHRDFKPANVLVGNDGRVRVLDFGLARPEQSSPEMSTDAPAGSTGEFRRADVDAELSIAGTVMGTPAYMAPEQHRGQDVDARADQYGYCLALYEALYGDRPFPRGDFRAQYEAKLAPLPPRPADTPVPEWLHAIVARGLAADPADRFPTMDALLRQLSRRPTRRPRAVWTAAATLVGLAAGALAMVVVRDAPDPICEPASSRLEGVWDASRRTAVGNAFTASGVVYARGAFEGTAVALDGYAQRWTEMHERVCASQSGPSGLADELGARRRACLERRLGELDELTRLLVDADADLVEGAVGIAHELTPVELCADDEALRRHFEPPSDPELRSRIDHARRLLTRAAALRDAAKYDAALEQVLVAFVDAESFEPALAEALYVRGTIEDARGDHDTAVDTLHRAAWVATASHHDQAAAQAWIALVDIVGYHQADYRYAERIAGLARASLRAAGDSPDLTATLLGHEAALDHQRGQFESALASQQQALELLETLLGPEHPRVARSLDNLGLELRALGRYDRALEAHQRALAMLGATLGDGHPGLVGTLNHIGNVHFARRRIEEATQYYQRACDLAERAHGAGHSSHADCLANLGAVDFLRGDLEQAESRHRAALALREQQLGVEHPDVAAALNNLALDVAALGRANEALQLHQRALVIKRASLDPRHPSIARSLGNIGRLMLQLDSPRPALARFEEAQQILVAALGPEHPELGFVLAGLARARLAVGDREAALEPAQRAVDLLDGDPASVRLAEARFALARALGPEQAARARELAESARAAYQGADAGIESERAVAEIEAWSSQPSGPRLTATEP